MPPQTLIDDYIAKAQPFAKPILNHLRDLVYQACPEVEERMKWSMPHFDYKGEMMCSMASFKQHCSFGFWKASLMKDITLMENARKEDSMGHLGRITSLDDLPSDKKILGYIREAMKLNDLGIKVKKVKTPPKQELVPPELFIQHLRFNKRAQQTFTAFSDSCKREYIQWIVEAKTEATQIKRITQAIEWMAEGKKRNWKYETK